VLDEPTNHLDTESREALELALDAYDGTVLIISHDRALLDAVATHTLALEGGAAVLRPGGYGDLVAAREADRALAPAPALTTKPAKKHVDAPAPRRAGPRKPSQKVQREVQKLEAQIATTEERIAAVEAQLVDPATLADRDALAQRGEEHRTLQEELAWLMHRWEEAAEAVDG